MAATPRRTSTPASTARRRRPARRISAAIFWAVVGTLAALFAANLAGYGPALVKHESVRVVLPPQRHTPLVQPARNHNPVLFTPKAIDKIAGELAETSSVFSKSSASPAPAVTVPAPAQQRAQVDVDINVNVNVHQQSSQPVLICPKVGYYVLSHEPTTDSRQFNDQGNWNPGHLELVRECRNGVLNEFSRWIGHKLPE